MLQIQKRGVVNVGIGEVDQITASCRMLIVIVNKRCYRVVLMVIVSQSLTFVKKVV